MNTEIIKYMYSRLKEINGLSLELPNIFLVYKGFVLMSSLKNLYVYKNFSTQKEDPEYLIKLENHLINTMYFIDSYWKQK